MPGNADFAWKFVNYAPIVIGRRADPLTIWWYASAKNWFTGPKHTIDLPPGVSSADEMALEHEHHGYLTGEHDKPERRRDAARGRPELSAAPRRARP